MKIKIENPVKGGSEFTSHRQAYRFVEQGVAKWTSERRIRFIPEDKRNAAAALFAARVEGYDRIRRMMTLDQMRGIPILMPERMVGTK